MKRQEINFPAVHPCPALHYKINAWLHGGFGYKICFLLELAFWFLWQIALVKRWCRLWGSKKTSFQKITWELLYQYLCDIALQKWSASRYCRIQVVKAWDLRQPAKQFWMSKGFPRACKNLLRGFVSDWASLVQIIKKTDQTRRRRANLVSSETQVYTGRGSLYLFE